MTGRNPPNSLISLLTPEESLFVFLKDVLAAAKSSVLERPATASSVKPFPFPEKNQKIQNYSTRHNETLQQPRCQDPLTWLLAMGDVLGTRLRLQALDPGNEVQDIRNLEFSWLKNTSQIALSIELLNLPR